MTIQERNKQNQDRINAEIDNCSMAYKIKDTEGNTFVFKGIESSFPTYRTNGGSEVIGSLNGFEIIEKYIVIE